MSRKNQMREFAGVHAGQTYTSTELAKALGWAAGGRKPAFNSKAARHLARKCGAKVVKVERKVPVRVKDGEDFRDKLSPGYDITF